MSSEHGHSQAEVETRIGAPAGRGYLRDMIYGGIDGEVTTFASWRVSRARVCPPG